MAYPTVDAPYGLKPVKMLDGSPYNGAVRTYKIASGYAANIFNGDIVKLVTAGTVERDAGTATMTPIGVFVGCEYTDPKLGKIQSPYWPTGTAADDAVAFVVEGTNVLFKTAVLSSGTTIGSMALGAVGANASVVNNTGSTVTGLSAVGANASTATTATRPLRVVAGVEETKDSSGNFTEVYVKWNAGHQLTNTTGI